MPVRGRGAGGKFYPIYILSNAGKGGQAQPGKHSRLSGGADDGEKVGRETEKTPYGAKDTRTR